jgi:hypothetical protein
MQKNALPAIEFAGRALNFNKSTFTISRSAANASGVRREP